MVTSGQDVSYQNIAWATDPKLYGQTPGFKSVQDNVRGATCGPNSGEVKKCSASVCQSALCAGFDGCKVAITPRNPALPNTTPRATVHQLSPAQRPIDRSIESIVLFTDQYMRVP